MPKHIQVQVNITFGGSVSGHLDTPPSTIVVNNITGTMLDQSLQGWTPSNVAAGDFLFVQMPDQSVFRWRITAINSTSPFSFNVEFADDPENWPTAYNSSPINPGIAVIAGAKLDGSVSTVPSVSITQANESLTSAAAAANDLNTVSKGVEITPQADPSDGTYFLSKTNVQEAVEEVYSKLNDGPPVAKLQEMLLANLVQGANMTITQVSAGPDTGKITLTAGTTGGSTLADNTYGDIEVLDTGATMKIVDNAITGPEIADGSITIAQMKESLLRAEVIGRGTTLGSTPDSPEPVLLEAPAAGLLKITPVDKTISPAANAKLQFALNSINNNTVIGNVSGSSAAPVALTVDSLRTLLDAGDWRASKLLPGLVPPTGTDSPGTTKFLAEDQTYQVPSVSGVDITVTENTDTVTIDAGGATDTIAAATVVAAGVMSKDHALDVANNKTHLTSFMQYEGFDTGYNLASQIPYVTNGNPTVNARANLQNLLNGRLDVRLPPGDILVDASGGSLTVRADTIIRGTPGKTRIYFRNPSSSQAMMILNGDNIRIEGVELIWDPAHPPTGGGNNLMIAIQRDGIRLKDVILTGCGITQTHFWTGQFCASFWGCTDLQCEDCEFNYAMGSAFGVDCIGGKNHVFDRCKFMYNGADGIKTQISATYGIPENFRFTDCETSYNGQMVIQGQTQANQVLNSGGSFTASTGFRYRLNFASPGTLNIQDVATGVDFALSKTIGSADVTLDFPNGHTFEAGAVATDGTVYGSATDDDYRMLRITKTGATTWKVVHFTNGQGWDGFGYGHAFKGCVAIGNETGGFQFKPVGISGVNEIASGGDISLTDCIARDGWGASGAGFIVQPNSSETLVPETLSISFVNCKAINNKSHGFLLASGENSRGVTAIGCVSRSNLNGFTVYGGGKAISMVGCHAMGNGKHLITALAGFNYNVQDCHNVRITDCFSLGVDPYDQDLLASQVAGATPRCYSMAFYTTSGSLDDVVVRGVTHENCLTSGGDPVRYYVGGVPSNAAAFDGSNAPGVLTFTT